MASGLGLTGCGYTGSHAQQVREWVAQNSFAANQRQVLADVHSVELAVTKGTPLQLRTVCGGLTSDVGTLYSTLVTPDHILTSELAKSMEDLFRAAASCSVASSTTAPKVKMALGEIHAGLAELAVADRRLAHFRVHSSSAAQG